MSADLRIMRPAEVANTLGVHRCTLWRWIKRGNFPAPLQLGRNAVGFRQSDVAAWLDSRAQTRHLHHLNREKRPPGDANQEGAASRQVRRRRNA